MPSYLVVFDRAKGAVVEQTEFARADDALRQRLAIEARGVGPTVEVAVLRADSAEALLRTHSRYFRSVVELAEAMETVAS